MANPFKDAEKRKKVAPGGNQEQSVAEEVVETSTPTVEKKVVEKENPLEGMIEQKPEGKSYGFYLSAEAAEKLDKLAKQNKCSKSKALDALLRSL